MLTIVPFMNPAPTSAPKRSAGQWIVAVLFGLFAAGFFLRTFFFGYKWLRHAVEGDANFKVLTLWALVYTLVCTAIAWVVFRLPRDEGAASAGFDRGSGA